VSALSERRLAGVKTSLVIAGIGGLAWLIASILSGIHAVDFPDLSASGDQALIDLEYDIRLMLGCLKPDECLQLSLVGSG